MKLDLLTLVTSDLLEQFGAGNHKPGSGSAAAFQGMISAQLLITVIELTNEPKRRKRYHDVLPGLVAMQTEIRDSIYPQLTQLFEEDSVQFGITINLRKRRNAEKDGFKRNILARQALTELKVAIDLPLKIAELCIRLGEIGESVFDNGFQSARGDSQVALSGSVAAIGGCLSIIQLNLSLFGSDEYKWIKNVKGKCDRLRKKFDVLNSIASLKMDTLAQLVDDKASLYEQLDELINTTRSKELLTNKDLEQFARQFQNLIWQKKEAIWTEDIPTTGRPLMTPSVIFKKVLGYSYDNKLNLGGTTVNGIPMDVAGIIDQANKLVRISNHIPNPIQNFTAAHELGHALLHKQTVMHRDLPVDSLNTVSDRPIEELQADRFATYFLMPAKHVRYRFKTLFYTDLFAIDSDTTFKLTGTTARDLRKECKNLQGLCFMLASTGTYDGNDIQSLSAYFNVSDKAMAIRLEQLGLVQF